MNSETKRHLRSKIWFDNPDNIGMTAVHLERFLNYGLTRDELTSGKPIIGIAQSGSDLVPCNRHHRDLQSRVRDGIIAAGGVPFEFPMHPLQESCKRPTAALDRNLAYLSLVEVMFGYPLDGVVLTTGCDKTTPAALMAAATVNIPSIVLSGGPMLDGHWKGKLVGSGTVIWQARMDHAAGLIDYKEFIDVVAAGAPSIGHCNTMGTASTMNALAEALGMSLPNCAAIPAPYRERGQMAYETGRRAVEIVLEDLKPSDIMTREAFENAIATCSAIGGSGNAPIHLIAIARHLGIELTVEDWERVGLNVPLLLNMQPAGEYLGEAYYRAGGLPAVLHELSKAGQLHTDVLTINGLTIGENVRHTPVLDRQVIRPYSEPLKKQAGFKALRGNLFDSAIMKTSVISDDFRRRYLSNPDDPNAFEGKAVVFDGPEDYHQRIDDPSLEIDEHSILFIRGAGAVAHPGSTEVVNMQPPAALIRAGIEALPCVGDGRQSGTSASPSILNASPEAALGGGLALLCTGDRVRIDLNTGAANMLVPEEVIAERRKKLEQEGGYSIPESQTPWQEIQRGMVDQLSDGMVLKPAIKYQRVAQKHIPRDSH
ncbi:IlvD/Edd family dehydratase [Klebsiella quasipneumoniae]|uniref:IlvD/Edd family dehydratase n=1 Tax=Klebsiella quasipneumoniae TaxID=1463165 RepID=UPI003F6DB1D6